MRQRKEDLAIRTEIKEAEARTQAITEELIMDERESEIPSPSRLRSKVSQKPLNVVDFGLAWKRLRRCKG